MNVLHQGKIKQYKINFDQHKNFYDFFVEGIANKFIKSVYERFLPDGERYKIVGYCEIVNYNPQAHLQSARLSLKNVYTATHFNS